MSDTEEAIDTPPVVDTVEDESEPEDVEEESEPEDDEPEDDEPEDEDEEADQSNKCSLPSCDVPIDFIGVLEREGRYMRADSDWSPVKYCNHECEVKHCKNGFITRPKN